MLLVDDEPDNLVALSAVLEPLDRPLVTAGSGEEALKLLLRHEFAVILLDVRMPGLDGFETAAVIKEREKTRHIPLIFVTAASKDTEHAFRGYSEGAVDYLLKPYDPAVLRSKVAVFVKLYENTAALEESEHRFRTAFSNAPSGMALISPEGRLASVNRALADMLGRPQTELVGDEWDSIIHPDERRGDEGALQELLDGERTLLRVERRCLHADGHALLLAISVSPMGAPGALPEQLIAQLEDVTERERAQRERAERLREQAARAEAEAVADMVRSVQRVSDAALAHLALDDLLPELLERIGEILDADGMSVLLAEPDVGGLGLRAASGLNGFPAVAHVPIDETSFAGRVAVGRRALVIADAQTEARERPLDAAPRDSGVRSLIGVPLFAEGEVSGVLCAASLTPNRFDDNDSALLSLVADRAALAIANARLYEREHNIVETLQRSLLPARLPQLPGMSIAARYQPGGADVGGDWYDAIALKDGGVGLAMGDVTGHGIEAAAMMGELRSAVRAYALEGLSPSAVLTRLDALVQQLEGDQMATLTYLVIEPDWSRLRFASAGHPPALLLGPDGTAEYLWEGRSSPLGVWGPEPSEEATAELDWGSKLALYTDGLVEVRGEPLLDGLERLKQAVLSGPDEPDALCEHVIDSMLDERGARDDVAFLALRTLALAPEGMRLEVLSDPASIRQSRHLLARWLERVGATPEETREIQLASHEACANAIEHAYRFGDDVVLLEARLVDGEVGLTVSDSGSWQERRDPLRGRGIELMRELMDRVSVDGGPQGTTVELWRRLAG